jgi:uncharacterized phosphatase
MEFYIIRHGETDWNIQHLLQGRENIPLNETGIRQANDCGAALRGLHVDRVIASPLSRAKQTAEIIAGYLGASTVITEPDLVERDFGTLSGTTVANIFDVIEGADDIEPVEDVGRRIIGVLEKYAALPGTRTLVVSHGAALSAALSILTGGEIGTGKTRLGNTSVTIIDAVDGKLTVRGYNLNARDIQI